MLDTETIKNISTFVEITMQVESRLRAKYDFEAERLTGELEAMRDERDALTGECYEYEKRTHDLEVQVEELTGQKKRQAATVRELMEVRDRQKTLIDDLEKEANGLERELEAARQGRPPFVEEELQKKLDKAMDHIRRQGEKTLGTDAQLKEQVKRLVDEKQMLAQQLNVLAGENDFLENRVSELRAKVDMQAEALAIYRVPTPRDCPFCGFPAEVHQLRKGEWYVACGNGECPVNPETNCLDTEVDAIEAWNNSYHAPKVTCDWR